MSGHRDNEAVDAFGRTVIAAGLPRNNGRTVVAANSAHRDVRVVDNYGSRGRANSNVQHDDRRDYGYNDGYRQQNNYHQQQNRGHGQQVRNIRYQDNRDGNSSGKRHSNYSQAVSNRIPPIMSFKSFMQAQHEDLAPEVFQRMYDQYHLLYLQDFSDSFFKASMVEEWFQDRYNPIRIQGLEEAAATRAVSESAALKASLVAHPKESVKAMCLDPPPNRKRAPTIVDSSSAAAPAGTTEDEEPKTAESISEMVTEDPTSAANVPIATKHLPGHEDRTLYISGIHAGCTKASLETAIISALAAVDDALVPERIIIAQPVWTNSHGVDKFERFAWVVMPTVEAAKQALKELGDLKVDVFEPLEPEDHEPVVSFTFTVHARQHHPKLYYENNIHCAHHLRVEADTARAMELAELLDEERRVPPESRLAAILAEPAVQSALVKPTDRLDVSIAYLRRVHFLNFYMARRYRDEAHMLSMGPSVPCRVKEYVPPPLPGAMETEQEQGQEQESAEEAATAASNTSSTGAKRKRDRYDDDQGEEEAAAEEEGDAACTSDAAPAAEAMEVEGQAPKPPLPPTKRPANITVRNPRIDTLLAELRHKRVQAQQRLENPELLGSADEEEAKILAAIQEKSFDRCVEARLKLEKEGKCRCCYLSCSKLFKGVDFLTKHMHLKHADFCADVLLKDAEPFMKKRFDAEPMGARPLPPVEVEAHGRTELKSVKEILDKYLAAVAAGGHAAIAIARRDSNNANNAGGANPRRHSGGGTEGQEFRKRGQDDRDRRATIGGGSGPHGKQQGGGGGGHKQYVEPRSEDNFSRKISSYIDVDAPKESAVSIDYGVALPPIKKRKTVITPKKAPEAAPEAASSPAAIV